MIPVYIGPVIGGQKLTACPKCGAVICEAAIERQSEPIAPRTEHNPIFQRG